jgi:hypothetical protein
MTRTYPNHELTSPLPAESLTVGLERGPSEPLASEAAGIATDVS